MRTFKSFFYFFLSVMVSSAWANFAEYYGPSAAHSGLSNQFTDNPDDPANNYYVPALAAFSKSISFSYTASYVASYFRSINNIVVENLAISDGTRVGAINTDYDDTVMNSIHAVFPILEKRGSKLAFSLYLPTTGNHFNTLSPLAPEYVMYRARHQRTIINANWAIPFNQNWAMSVGAMMGTSIESQTTATLRQNTQSGSSFSQTEAEGRPVFAGLLSFVGRFPNMTFYLGFQQEMKSKYESINQGLATNGTNGLGRFNYTTSSITNFDPMMIRLGLARNINEKIKGYVSAEYQFWSRYESPTISLQSNPVSSFNSSNVNNSVSYQVLDPRDIIIPKVGVEFKSSDYSTFRFGFAYRPTHLQGNFSGSGNLIDFDSYITSVGYGLDFRLLGEKAQANFAFQWHTIPNDTITKTPGSEDGLSADKVGAPFYNVGGNIFAASAGISLSLANLFR